VTDLKSTMTLSSWVFMFWMCSAVSLAAVNCIRLLMLWLTV